LDNGVQGTKFFAITESIRRKYSMEEEKVVLDRKSFEALAVDTRIKILKSLKERRKTLSEIAKEQRMSVSGIKEHLETLEGVGLIRKMDDGHKWKYYELTKKGSDIVTPKELRVWVLLSISVIALAAALTAIFAPESLMLGGAGSVMSAAPSETAALNSDAQAFAPMAAAPAAAGAENGSAPRAMAAAEKTPGAGSETASQEMGGDMTAAYAVAGISGVTLLGCLYILARNRMRPISP
jgi:DNA-binding transcriptional ArsR family regulator